MSWETLAYTDAGIELLMDAVSGKQLTITQAVGGSGLANAAVLHAQTDVTGERHALELLGIKSVEENGSAARRVKIRITGAEDTYTLHQIALFGRQTGRQKIRSCSSCRMTAVSRSRRLPPIRSLSSFSLW